MEYLSDGPKPQHSKTPLLRFSLEFLLLLGAYASCAILSRAWPACATPRLDAMVGAQTLPEPPASAAALQTDIEARGLEIFARMEAATPGLFHPRNVTQRPMDWSMRDEALKAKLFGVADVLPATTPPAEYAR